MKPFKNFIVEAKEVIFIVMPKINKGRIKSSDSLEVKATSPKEAREKAAKRFGLQPNEVIASTKFTGDAHMNEVAANSVAGGGVDMAPNAGPMFFTRRDKRKKEDTERMYRRSLGMKFINAMIEKRKK